jgi:hypothetical protein
LWGDVALTSGLDARWPGLSGEEACRRGEPALASDSGVSKSDLSELLGVDYADASPNHQQMCQGLYSCHDLGFR